jgi:hypothetical protein
VSSQVRTEKKPLPVASYKTTIVEFLLDLLELQQQPGRNVPRDPVYGRFGPRQTWNVDQIPLQFTPNRRTSLNLMGEACWLPTYGEEGLGKRCATLVLCLRAQGPQIVRPLVIFKGKGKLPAWKLE